MKKFVLAAVLAVFAIGFGMEAASAADSAAPQQTWAELDAQLRPLMDQMYQKRSELAGLYNSGAIVDQAKIEGIYKEIADIQAQMFQIQQQAMGPATGGYGRGYGMGMGGGYGACFGGGMGGGCGGYGMGGGYGMRGGMGGGWHRGGRW
jgi:hypothetical protein